MNRISTTTITITTGKGAG
ncbi:hypothetical protein V5I26_001113 [Salmonella enterica subsp. diarizonae serovar 11:k:z53]